MTDEVRTLDDILGRFDRWRRPVIVGHVVPDADCLGSIFSVARVWGGNGARPTVALPAGSVSQRLEFMVKEAGVTVASSDDFAQADGFAVVDTAKKDRCNVGKQMSPTWSDGREIVNIDHHDTNTRFGTINWIVPEAGSSAELVHRLIRRAGKKLDAVTAMLLYCGIHADTAGFSLSGTTPEALEAGADLVRAGADVTHIGELLCRSQRLSEFTLLKTVYANTRLVADEKIAYSTADYQEISGAGCTAADIDDQVNVPRSLQGIRMAMLFTEGHAGKIRVNFRGEGGLNILPLAQSLGGGGHKESAGAVIEGGMAEVVEKVLAKAAEFIHVAPVSTRC